MPGLEHLVEPPHSFRGRTRDPVPTQRADEIGCTREVALNNGSSQDRPDVVDLEVHPSEPLNKPIPSVGRRSLTSRSVVFRATQVDDFLLASLS